MFNDAAKSISVFVLSFVIVFQKMAIFLEYDSELISDVLNS